MKRRAFIRWSLAAGVLSGGAGLGYFSLNSFKEGDFNHLQAATLWLNQIGNREIKSSGVGSQNKYLIIYRRV